jgi:hypothetical protein
MGDVAPAFDPTKPFSRVGGSEDTPPPFDPKAPFAPVGAAAETPPPFDPQAAHVPVPRERPQAAGPRVEPTQLPPVQPMEGAEPSPPPTEHNALVRGFVSGMVEQNPQMTAEALEGWSHLAPDQFKESLRKASTDVGGIAKLRPEEYKQRSKGMWNIGGIDDALTWAGETIGQGVASSVPSMVTGVGGALIGGRVGGKPGAVAGGLAGATIPSATLNYGEVYKALKDEKVDPKEAADYAAIATPFISALDIGSLGSIVGRFGSGAIRSELNHAIAKRIAVEAAKGAGGEGVTEAIQEVIKDAVVSMRSGKPFWTTETAKGVIESGVGGALTGGAMGGVAGVVPGSQKGTVPVGPEGVPVPNQVVVTPEDIAAQVAAGGIPGQTPTAAPPVAAVSTPEAPPATPPAAERAPTIQANEPVTTVEDGMKVTRVLHGPAGEYTVDTSQETPTFVPSDPAIRAAREPGAVDVATVPTEGAPVEDLRQEAPQPVQGLYSRLRQWVDEKGPLNATAARWISLLNRGDFTKEEMRDLGMPAWIGGGYNRVSKEEVLNYVDAMTAPLYEVTRQEIGGVERAAMEDAIKQQIADVINRDPTARVEGPRPPTGWASTGSVIDTPVTLNYNHPEISKLVNQYEQVGKSGAFAQYGQYTMPGPAYAYSEITMHLPRKAAPPKSVRRGRETIAGTPEAADYYGKHYDSPNEMVTIRTTIRETPSGQRIAVLEEIQSDLHQEGRKRGYGRVADYEFMGKFEALAKTAKVKIPRDWAGPPKADMFKFAVAKGAVTWDQVNRYIQEVALANAPKVPDSPYKESWHQLGFTRFLMWAANQGIRHVAWVDSVEQMRRYGAVGSVQEVATRRKGMETFYDHLVPGMAKKWAKKLGGTVGWTDISMGEYEAVPSGLADPSTGQQVWTVSNLLTGENVGITFSNQMWAEEWAVTNGAKRRLRSLTLPPSAVATIEQGMASYSREETPSVDMSVPSPQAALDGHTVKPLVEALNSLIKRLKVGIPVTVVVHPSTIKYLTKNAQGQEVLTPLPGALGGARTWGTRAEIHINLRKHKDAAHLWATMVHEMGHIIMKTTYARASDSVKVAVQAAYDAFVAQNAAKTTPFNQLFTAQSNAVSAMLDNTASPELLLSGLSQERYEYWTGFNEWFAEQVAKWATSDIKPLTHVERFFKGLGMKIVEYLKAASHMFGFQFEANQALADYLNVFMSEAPDIGATTATQTAQQTTTTNATQMGEGEPAVPQQPETGPTAAAAAAAFNGRPPKEVQEGLAYMDKFNWLYKMGLAIHQVAVKNPHIQALQDYAQLVAMAQLMKQQVMIAARDVLKTWNKLGERQANAVSFLIDDVMNLTYLTPDEVRRKVARHPTQAELTTLAQKHGVTPAGLATYASIARLFDDYLTRLRDVLRSEAMKISDQVRRDLKLAAIDKQIAAYRSKPYFPSMRFGNWTITVRDAAKKVIHFETFETQRQRDRALREFNRNASTNFVPQAGYLDKQTRPMLGIPTALLDLMSEKMQLTSTQRDALEQLKFELSPAQSFKHRFQHKKRIEGYSMDFRRAFANYFFHGANYLMKVMYSDRMRGLAKQLRDEVDAAPNVTKRDRIKAYVNNHIEAWLNPGSDWAALRSVGALWQLAGVASAASQNLTQTILTSYPFLGSKFGDAQAMLALGRAGNNLQNFYSKARLQRPSNAAQKALQQGMADGIISETQAPELAGYADGNVLGLGFGGNAIQRNWTRFMETSMFMFEMAEQFNRRVVFRAAHDLAMKYPNNKHVRETVAKRRLIYDQRRAEGWTESEATAYVVAYDATFVTQFPYSKEFAPRFLKGKARAILVFKTFIQNYLFFLQAYPTAGARSLLIVLALYGLMGLPGSDDAQDVVRALWYQLFKEDMKLEHEVRKLFIMWMGAENGNYTADLVLHGMARRGYGIPQVMDMLEGTVGVDIPFPTFDRSKAGSFGSILPVDVDKLFGPPLQSVEKVIAEQGQKAVGPIFGLGYTTYKALFSAQADYKDFKNWEQMMPRALGNVSKAYRAWTEGGMRTSTGAQRVKYDVRDNEQMAEVIGMANGYNPFRQSYETEKAMAQYDAVKMIDIRREALMKQFGNAAIGRDQKEMERVRGGIRDFNQKLPQEHKSKAITSEGLEKSVRTRAEGRVLEEQGLSRQKTNIPVMRDVEQKLYPESYRELRKVPKGLTP